MNIEIFDGISSSNELKIDGNELSFPCRDDYLRHLIENGYASNKSDALHSAAIVTSIYRHWQSTGQIACEFGRRVALDPEKYDIKTQVINNDSGDLSDVECNLISSLINLATNPGDKTQAVSLLFPLIETELALTKLCKSLNGIEGWHLSAHLNPSDKLERVYVRLSLEIDNDTLAEILGLGPFDFLANTRQAPITALEIRTKRGNHPKQSTSAVAKFKYRAHLASLDTKLEPFKDLWSQSEMNRLALLGGDDSAAKAKVTFAIPASVWAA